MLKLPAYRTTLPWAAAFVGQHDIDPGKVDQYAANMRGGEVFPPVRVVALDGGYLIIDGHHRVVNLCDNPIEGRKRHV